MYKISLKKTSSYWVFYLST